ncbi:MAG: SLAC1 anion channel family protein [Deferribacterales bacterium]
MTETYEKNRLRNFPVTLFSTVMGVTGLAIAFLRYGAVMQTDMSPAKYLLFAVSVWFVIVLTTYIAKLIKYPEAVKEEFFHPVKLNFFPTMSISLLLLSIGYEGISHEASRYLWMLGTVIQITFTFIIIDIWFFGDFKITAVNPAWFIPVVGNILVPVSGVNHAGAELGWFFFSIGIVLWIALFTTVVYRMIFHEQLLAKFLPTLFIMIAPPAVGFISYVKLTGSLDPFSRILYYFALFITLMLFSMFRRLKKVPFYVSWWAYTFPLDAMTIATILIYKMTKYPLFHTLATFLLILTSAVVTVVFIRTVKEMAGGKVCVPE